MTDLNLKIPIFSSFVELRKNVVACRLCKRLVEFRENVPCKKAYEREKHWRRPVPGFGDEKGWLLITGLAPSAQGGNRTGRIFTGDESGRFLMSALYKEGFANQETSESLKDGLQLKGCYLTAAVKCVPPGNKPEKQEFIHCSRYYWNEWHLLKNITSVLVLGKMAFDAFLFLIRQQGCQTSHLRFVHGAKYPLQGLPTLYASYHPSPQNTNTGKLTEPMLRKILREIKQGHQSR